MNVDDYASRPAAGGAADNWSDLSGPQRRVMQAINGMGSAEDLPPEGLYITVIINASGLSEQDARQAISDLCDEGHLYTTSSDD